MPRYVSGLITAIAPSYIMLNDCQTAIARIPLPPSLEKKAFKEKYL